MNAPDREILSRVGGADQVCPRSSRRDPEVFRVHNTRRQAPMRERFTSLILSEAKHLFFRPGEESRSFASLRMARNDSTSP